MIVKEVVKFFAFKARIVWTREKKTLCELTNFAPVISCRKKYHDIAKEMRIMLRSAHMTQYYVVSVLLILSHIYFAEIVVDDENV